MRKLIKLQFMVICLLIACNSNRGDKPLLNQNASLSLSFKFSFAGTKMMASFINKRSGSMSVLYASTNTRTLVTWKRKSDDNWFGANIPGDLLSVEIVKASAAGSKDLIDYKNYNGQGRSIKLDTAGQNRRARFILDQQPSVMP